MLDRMYKHLDEGKIGGVVFLDLKKAFDTVDHGIMIRKLKSLGVDGNSVTWSASYLQRRQQKTKVGSGVSDLKQITHGVPQGSILGPLLFLIYINDLCDYVELCGTSMYADDTAIFFFGANLDEVRLGIQRDMQSVEYWMRQNHLSLNVKKTKMMLIGSRQRLRQVPNLSVSLNGQRVENMSQFKYLGMIIDNHLIFDKHIDFIIDKSTNKLGMLYKTRGLFNLETAKMLYNALILPHFDLGNTVYTVAPQYQLNRIQVVQNAAARLIRLILQVSRL